MATKYPINQPELGKKLFEIRRARGLTQLELREKSHVSVRTIQRIESGSVTPRTVTIKILLESLGENPAEWFAATDKPGNKLPTRIFSNMLLVNSSDTELKNALTPAWISGIIYLMMVLMEQGILAISDYLNEPSFMINSMIFIKFMAAISFVLFTRGLIALAMLFEIPMLKVAGFISMLFVAGLYLSEAGILLLSGSYTDVAAVIRTFAVVPLGVISIFLGLGILKLQDGMGKIAKIAGRLELIFGISYVSLIFSFIGLLLLIPLLIVEVVLISRAEQLVREGEM